jgi:YidC/Oxa1 family membrane protein insertase
MYSVLRWPQHPIHVPQDSELYAVVTEQIPQIGPEGEPITTQAQIDALDLPGPSSGTSFLGMNLLCPAGLPWQPAPSTLSDRATVDGQEETLTYPVSCAPDPIDRVPYYVFAVLMFATTFYQQRQMQKASPPGAASSQQQALLKVMPIMFGVFGIFFPAGLVVYWTTSNAWQIGQQYFMLKTRPTADQMAANANAKRNTSSGEPKKGFMSSMMERAEQQRAQRESQRKPAPRPGSSKKGPGKPGSGPGKPGSGPGKPGSGPGKGSGPKPGSSGGNGGDPKKRPER